MTSLPEPVVVITGGNRGIGFAVAKRLVHDGCRVVLLSRDPERGAAARAALGERAELVVGDLSTVRRARAAADGLLAACPRIDVLVHNAGLWPGARVLDEDGLERSFVVNHLAPFLLNHLLEPRLTAARARVVQVSAGLYVKGRADVERTATGAAFHPMRTYADTKLCNLMMTPLFAERWRDSGVTINAVHPGVIRTGLGDRSGPLGLLLKAFKLVWKSPATGARPVVRLARDPDLAGVTGRYFHLAEERPIGPPADDAELAARLWEQALELSSAGRDAR